MKLIHLTDTHLVNAGERLYGLDPRARLDAAIADINRHHRDAGLAVVTGDLTHFGDAGAYQQFTESMAALRIPHVALVGNHDRRRACLQHVSTAPRSGGFVQGITRTEVGTLMFLDTLDETTHAGRLCPERLVWLETALANEPAETPLFIFMHHPPFAVGVKDMDDIALIERSDFERAIGPYVPRIRHLFFGHVHRPISGSWNGIAFSTCKGTNHQVALDLSPDAPHLASHEPPSYAIALISQESMIVHTHDYLDRSPRFPFGKPGVDDRVYALGEFPA